MKIDPCATFARIGFGRGDAEIIIIKYSYLRSSAHSTQIARLWQVLLDAVTRITYSRGN